MKNKKVTNCESCVNYVWDDECQGYVCLAQLDEDEYVKFLKSSYDACPYYQLYDEYKLVRHQN